MDTLNQDIAANFAIAGSFTRLHGPLTAANLARNCEGIAPLAANDGGFSVDGAPISSPRIEASIGPVHGIQDALMPAKE